MVKPYPGFVGGSNTTQSPVANNERTVNFYVEPAPDGSMALYPTPGVSTFASITDAPGRGGILVHGGRVFAVIGASFVEIFEDGTTTTHGSVTVDANPATLCTNGDGGGQVFVTSGGKGYIFDLSANTLTQVIASGCTMGAHLDGYFLYLDSSTSTLYVSDLLDGTTWDPTQFAQRSIQPDPWVAMVVLDRYIWLLGSQTSEIWYNAGTFPFPFVPHPSGLISYGCAAPFSATVVSGALYWLAASAVGEGQVITATGFTPQIVSTFAMLSQIDGYVTLADAIGDGYQDLGHTFYLLTFPAARTTWAYDATEGGTLPIPPTLRWTERGTWDSQNAEYVAWRPIYHGYAFGHHLVLDRETGSIFRMSPTIGTDADGNGVRRLRRPPTLFSKNERLRVPLLELLLEPGLGLTTGQGENPLVSMRMSTDGGKTWGHERFRSAGARGEYGARVRWTRCGSGRKMQPEFVFTDPIPWRVLGATAQVDA